VSPSGAHEVPSVSREQAIVSVLVCGAQLEATQVYVVTVRSAVPICSQTSPALQMPGTPSSRPGQSVSRTQPTQVSLLASQCVGAAHGSTPSWMLQRPAAH
jgi:hypothetical protein